jgi:hypothetical protein
VPFWPGRRAANSVSDERAWRPILDRFTGPPDPELQVCNRKNIRETRICIVTTFNQDLTYVRKNEDCEDEIEAIEGKENEKGV